MLDSPRNLPTRPRARLTSASWSIVGCATLGVWTATAAIGVAGLELQYPAATIAPRPAPPIEVQELNVELSDDPALSVAGAPRVAQESPAAEPAPVPAPPPDVPAPPTPTESPRLVDLALPTPAIAFAVPEEAPVQAPVVPPAAPVAAATGVPSSQPTSFGRAGPPGFGPQQLSFGIGDGRQPRPDYPRESERAGQEGRVVVKLTVGETGRVVSTEVVEPCQWPLLNRSADRTIRERWRFSPGSVRVYQVTIVFRLTD